MKKIVYLVLGGIFLFIVFGNVLAEALEHDVKRVLTFPEAGGLIVLGSLLITGATFLRRRHATRGQ